jgi:mRNA interferase ChpB
MRTPKRGEIWHVELNPIAGTEQSGARPVFIVSDMRFNHLGLTLVCPITQGGNLTRFAGFAVQLMGTGIETQGVVMSNQARTIDMRARHGKFIELAPMIVTEDVLARLQAIIA